MFSISQIKTRLEDYLDKLAYKLRRRKVIGKRRQVKVVGSSMGPWGIERYGTKSIKVDAITFWCDRCVGVCVGPGCGV